MPYLFFFSSRRRHTRCSRDWSSDVCSSDLVVVHRATNRRAGYGELATAAAKLPVPKREELKLKPKSAGRYVGKGQVSYDLEALVTGKAIYGMDAAWTAWCMPRWRSEEHTPE